MRSSNEAGDVGLWHLADKPTASEFVRSWGYSGHGKSGPQCPLLTQQRHGQAGAPGLNSMGQPPAQLAERNHDVGAIRGPVL